MIYSRYTWDMPEKYLTYIHLIYTQDIWEIYCRYSWDIYEMYPRYSWDIPKISTRYARDVTEMYARCNWHMPEICLIFIHYMPGIYLYIYKCNIPEIYGRYVWDVPQIKMRYPWDIPGIKTGNIQDRTGICLRLTYHMSETYIWCTWAKAEIYVRHT